MNVIYVSCCDFSKGGPKAPVTATKRLASGGGDHMVRVWRLASMFAQIVVHLIQNIGGRKLWRLIANSPKFYLPAFCFTTVLYKL